MTTITDDNRFAEIEACAAAKEAVEKFNQKHQAKAAALQSIGNLLAVGSWAAITFEEEIPFSPVGTRAEPHHQPVSKRALDGDRIEEIVNERRRLMAEWERAYDAVPDVIKSSAANPRPRRTVPMPGSRRWSR